MHELADQLLSHLRAAWRYRWYAVVVSWIVAVCGWIVVYQTPERYEASARVHVNTQSVLRPLLSGLAVQPNVDQMVTMMSRTLVTRPNLEKVIRMAEMDMRLGTSEDQERLISRLAKDLTIQSAGLENLYTITYTDKNPQEAKRVVQSLLTIFVEGSLGDQRKDTDSARSFIDEQLKTYNEKLVAAENAVAEFRRRHLGLMAGDRRDYYTQLQEAQSALKQAALQLKETEDSRDAIRMQIEGSAEMPSLFGDPSADGGGHTEIDARIQSLEQKLDSLQLQYTEQHPDVIALVRTIDQLKEQKKAQTKLRKPTLPRSATQARDPVQMQLAVSLASAEASVAGMKARVAEYSRRYAELKAAADAVPQVDAEYTQLTRDYEVTKRNYDSLLSRRETAQISGDMESKSSVIDFRVIDPPRVSSVPKPPGRKLLMSLVLFAAIGGGLAVAFLISQIRPTFNEESRLREVSGLRVLGTVVMARTDAQEARRTRGLVALLISFASLLSAYAAIMVALSLTAARV